MRPTWIVASLILVSLAGCADTAPADDETTFICADCGEVTADTGVIRGVVVDDTITPLADVTLHLRGPDVEDETTSDENGVFFFDDLAPGSYFLDAKKLGFGPIQQSINVEAGVEPDVTRIQMSYETGTTPTFEVLPFNGYLQCSAVTLFFFWPCTLPFVGPIGDDDYATEWPLDAAADFIHIDMSWEATQPVGRNLYLNLFEPGAYDIVAWGGGPSPLSIDADNATVAPLNSAKMMAIEVASDGEAGLAGASVQQEFDLIMVVFHNFTPPEGYTYLENGEPELPS